MAAKVAAAAVVAAPAKSNKRFLALVRDEETGNWFSPTAPRVAWTFATESEAQAVAAKNAADEANRLVAAVEIPA